MGLAKAGRRVIIYKISALFAAKNHFVFLFFCNFEKAKMVFARFGFSWNFRLSYPRLRQALSR